MILTSWNRFPAVNLSLSYLSRNKLLSSLIWCTLKCKIQSEIDQTPLVWLSIVSWKVRESILLLYFVVKEGDMRRVYEEWWRVVPREKKRIPSTDNNYTIDRLSEEGKRRWKGKAMKSRRRRHTYREWIRWKKKDQRSMVDWEWTKGMKWVMRGVKVWLCLIVSVPSEGID